MPIKDFDAIFSHIGGFGLFQWILYGENCFINVLYGFLYYGQMFMTLTPPHWCSPPTELLEYDLTQLEIQRLTIPQLGVNGDGTPKFDSCRIYKTNFSEVLDNGLPWPNSSLATEKCQHGWQYDFSLYYPTITSQLDWVCDDNWKPATAQSLYFVGSFFGCMIFGWLADSYGRLPVIVLTNLIGAVAGTASAFASSFASFAALRFIVGMTFDAQFLIVYMLVLEYVSSEWRTFAANSPIMIFLTASMCSIPWIAVGLADWSYFAMAMHIPQFVCFIFIWTMPESPRWLIGKGRIEQTEKIVMRAAAVNRRPLSDEFIKEFKEYAKAQSKENDSNVSALELLKTPVLRKRFIVLVIMWCVILMSYDGHIRNTENLGFNVFITFSLAGAVELPADFITMILMEKWGRRLTTVLSLVVSGIMALVLSTFNEENYVIVLVLAITCRFLITMAINVGTQYIMEVLPTVARAQGNGAIHTIGMAATLLSPYIVYLSNYGFWMPYFVLGVVGVAGGLTCCLLPETLNANLPDTLQDGETFGLDQPMCYNPCARITAEEAEKGMEDVKKEVGVTNPAFNQ